MNLRPLIAPVVGALAISVLAPVAANAAPAEKVDVCHYNPYVGEWQVNMVSVKGKANSLQAHLDHGDALPGEPVPGMEGYTFDDTCTPVADPVAETIWAVAYLDNDTGDGNYNPAVDTLFAKVVEANGDNVPSVGDTVVQESMNTVCAPPYNVLQSVNAGTTTVTSVDLPNGEFSLSGGGRVLFEKSAVQEYFGSRGLVWRYGTYDGLDANISGDDFTELQSNFSFCGNPGQDNALLDVDLNYTVPETIWAVAYVDNVDDGAPYDAAVDTMIAKVVDDNGGNPNGSVDAGDALVLGEFPDKCRQPWTLLEMPSLPSQTITSIVGSTFYVADENSFAAFIAGAYERFNLAEDNGIGLPDLLLGMSDFRDGTDDEVVPYGDPCSDALGVDDVFLDVDINYTVGS